MYASLNESLWIKNKLELVIVSIVTTKNSSQMKLKLKVKGKRFNNNISHKYEIQNEVMKNAEK